MTREQTAWEWWQPPPAKDSDTAISPRWIADWLGHWAELDPCAHPQQLVHAEMMIAEANDGLRHSWSERFAVWLSKNLGDDRGTVAPRVWCNPPYSRPFRWVVEGVELVRDGGSVVWFLRADMTTRWARLALETARDYGGWAGLTRGRCPHGAVSPSRPDLPVVWPKGAGWSGHLMVAAGLDVPAPPRERLWLLELDQTACVPMRTTV